MAESRRTAAVIVAVVVGLLAIAAAALAGCGGSSDPMAGYWIGTANGQQVLVRITQDGDSFTIVSNPDAKVGTVKKSGGSLVVDTHAVKMEFTQPGTDQLRITLSGTVFKTPATIELARVTETEYADAATVYGVGAIRKGLAMWKGGGGKTYPPASEVSASGALGKMVSPWPTNMFTGEKMKIGDGQGDFSYTLSDGGKQYTIAGHLSDGGTTDGSVSQAAK